MGRGKNDASCKLSSTLMSVLALCWVLGIQRSMGVEVPVLTPTSWRGGGKGRIKQTTLETIYSPVAFNQYTKGNNSVDISGDVSELSVV